jgi:hypothetical protein
MTVRDEHTSMKGLAIVERYEAFVLYVYPVLQKAPRRDGNARDGFMATMFEQVALFHQAAKSDTPSRLYAADANMATLRFWLRFAANSKVRIITRTQERTALKLLAEVGGMLNAWIAKPKGERG